jgi:hypothetical protein
MNLGVVVLLVFLMLLTVLIPWWPYCAKWDMPIAITLCIAFIVMSVLVMTGVVPFTSIAP